MSRLGPVDRAGRKSLRKWAEEHGHVFDEDRFLRHWIDQGKRGGAEHQVYYDPKTGRWFKRLYHGVNSSILGDYLVRMRLHAVLFPETAYRLEGFTINPKSKDLAPVVSQPHVEVDTSRPLVTKSETDDLMATMGFAPVQLIHDGKLQRAMHANGPAMLFGAAREIIRAATGRGPWSAVIIPSTNFLVGLPPLEAPAMAQDPTAAPAKKTVRKITRKPKTRQG